MNNVSVKRGADRSAGGVELTEVLVSVRRVSKVVKGGRRFSFSVLVVLGDGRGRVGYGLGKHSGVSEAKTKAVVAAKKSMMRVHLREGRTLHHDYETKFCSVKILVRSARKGTGVIAGVAMRAVFESLGVKDVVAKVLGASSNPHNVIGALFKAFSEMSYPKHVAGRRNKRVKILREGSSE